MMLLCSQNTNVYWCNQTVAGWVCSLAVSLCRYHFVRNETKCAKILTEIMPQIHFTCPSSKCTLAQQSSKGGIFFIYAEHSQASLHYCCMLMYLSLICCHTRVICCKPCYLHAGEIFANSTSRMKLLNYIPVTIQFAYQKAAG